MLHLDNLSLCLIYPPMPMHAAEIEKRIKTALPDAAIKLVDTAGDGDHYSIEVVSASFKGKSKVAQHQMIYAALGADMGTTLHALAIQTRSE